MSAKEVFEMEFAMTQAFAWYHTEFFEGVRALLVDKDRKPQWRHRDVKEVSREEVLFFFDRPERCKLDILSDE